MQTVLVLGKRVFVKNLLAVAIEHKCQLNALALTVRRQFRVRCALDQADLHRPAHEVLAVR